MEKFQNVILPDGHKYSGYGEYRNGDFYPNGFGRKDFGQMYAKGNFLNGVLNGPAIWIGTTEKHVPSGHIMLFRPDGFVNIGLFENGELLEEMSIQELIDQYYGSVMSDEDGFFAAIFGKKSSSQLAREKKREQ